MPWLWLAPPAIALIGLGFYMLHNTLQTNATQMAPEARGLAVSLFAFALFTRPVGGRGAGRAGHGPLRRRGRSSSLAAVAILAIAFWFRRQLRAPAGLSWRDRASAHVSSGPGLARTRRHELARHGRGGRRSYHHGNLREALISAALDLIAQKGPAGFTFAEAARARPASARPRPTAISATATP